MNLSKRLTSDELALLGAALAEIPLSDDELLAVRGLIKERYAPTAAAPPPAGPLSSANLTFPEPSEMHMWPDWLVMIHAANTLPFTPDNARLVDELRMRGHALESASIAPPGGSPSFINWAVPAILEVFVNHTLSRAPFGQSWCAALDGSVCEGNWDDDEGWYDHVAPLIAAHLEQALTHEFPEPVPASADTLRSCIAVSLWGKRFDSANADQIGDSVARDLLKDFVITHK